MVGPKGDGDLAYKRKPALEVARWRSPTDLWLDHAAITENDLEKLQDVEKLTLWNVTYPEDMFSHLPHLWWLDVRGGSGNCVMSLSKAKGLKYLRLNQIRGLQDIDAIAHLARLELLSLYGLAKVVELPTLSALKNLQRIEVGQMKGLQSLTPIFEARQLREILLIKNVPIIIQDVSIINEMPELRAFGWEVLDVPVGKFQPILDAVCIARVRAMHAADWFEQKA